MKTSKITRILYYTWLIVLVVVPILLVIGQSFLNQEGEFSLINYQTFFSPIYLKMTFNSFLYAFIITLICLILAFPLAYGLTKIKHQQFFIILIMIPSWFNLLLKTYSFMGILGNNGIISQISEILSGNPLSLMFTISGFLVVSIYTFLPFVIIPLYNGINDINQNIIRAGYDLGASRIEVIRHIILPQLKDSLLSAIQIVFIPTLSIFMITRLIAGNRIITLGTAIEQHFLTTGNWGMGSAIGTILIVILALSIIGVNSSFKLEKKTTKGADEKDI